MGALILRSHLRVMKDKMANSRIQRLRALQIWRSSARKRNLKQELRERIKRESSIMGEKERIIRTMRKIKKTRKEAKMETRKEMKGLMKRSIVVKEKEESRRELKWKKRIRT